MTFSFCYFSLLFCKRNRLIIDCLSYKWFFGSLFGTPKSKEAMLKPQTALAPNERANEEILLNGPYEAPHTILPFPTLAAPSKGPENQ
jgi:hypothetical protein